MRSVHEFARLSLGLVALTLAVAHAMHQIGASAQEKQQPRWAPSIEKGLEEAKERGVALMVVLNMDNERGNQGMVDNVYTDAKFLKATEKCVVAVGSLFQHGTKGGTGGQKLCERFGSVTCEQHQAIEKVIRQDWLKRGPDDDVESPRHFFLAPDGRMLFQRVWTMRAESLAELMTRASELCTPGRLANWNSRESKLERATDSAQSVRETALQELIAENDADLDQELAALAKKSKDPMVTGSILASFALADTIERRALAHSALSHKAPEVRMLVAHAMHQSGAADHLPPLVKRAGKEKDGKAKGEIFRALGEMGKGTDDEKKIVTVLLKSVGNSKDDARAHACVAIAGWIDEKGVTPALQKVLVQGGDRTLRSAAVWALGYSSANGVQKGLKDYRDGLSRRDWRVKNMTDAAIAKLRGLTKNEAAYDAAPERFLPHPAEGVEEEEEEERGGR
jgi:HEAT repeat protein